MGQTFSHKDQQVKTIPKNDAKINNEFQTKEVQHNNSDIIPAENSIYVLELAEGKYYVGRSQDPNERINNHIHNNGSAWTQKYKPIKTLGIYEMKDKFDENKYTLELMKDKGIMNVRGGSFCKIVLDDNEIGVIEKLINGNENGCYYCGSTYHFIKDCDVKNKVKKGTILNKLDNDVLTKNGSILNQIDDNSLTKKASEHTQENGLYVCEVCGKTFETSSGLKKHHNSHYKDTSKVKVDKPKIESKIEQKIEPKVEQKVRQKKEKNNKVDEKKSATSCYRCGRDGHYAQDCYAKQHIKGYYIK